MIKILYFILLASTQIIACTKIDGCVELTDKYRLWVISANEHYLTNSDDVYILGPKIESLAVNNGYIFGKNSQLNYHNLENKSGYFFINQATKELYAGLSEAEFQMTLNQYKLKKIYLVGAGEFMKQRIKINSCPK